ncbi:MAG: DMT family transporter [Pseudomonadota bacterium]
MTQDRPLLGISLMLGFCLLAPLGDSIAKLLGPIVPLALLLAIRFGVQAGLLLPLCRLQGVPIVPPAHLLLLVVLRTLLHIAGVGMMFTALRFLPLADAIAIAFVMPFILLLLGKLFLGEEVGPRRIAACTVGFAGSLMVIQPSFAEVGAAALLPLGVALSFALFMLTTRKVAKDVGAIPLQAFSGLLATLVLLCVVLVTGEWTALATLSTQSWLLLVLIGIVGTVAHLLMTWSLRYAPSATLAPMQYLEIPVATFFGWLIFSDLPGPLASTGILVTMAAGLYIVWREGRATRAAPPAV